jgi:hypothetical protein
MYEAKVCPITISSKDFCKGVKSAICQNYTYGNLSKEKYFDIVPSYSVAFQSNLGHSGFPQEIKSGIYTYAFLQSVNIFIPFKIQGVECCIQRCPFHNDKILVHIPTNVKIE